MKVAIIGAKGFVGSHIMREALRRGWSVNQIGSRTKNSEQLLHDSDAVVHSVGSFMADKRYKKLVSEPVSVNSLAQLAFMKLGLDSGSPLRKSPSMTLDQINFGTVKLYVDELLKPRRRKSSESKSQKSKSSASIPGKHEQNAELGIEKPRIPFVFISAANWELADPAYIASKRHAEQYIASHPELRPVFLRPGMIAPPEAETCSEVTPRHLLDMALVATNSDSRVSVGSIALAACDAIEDTSVEGVIGCDVLRELDSQEFKHSHL